MTQINRLKDAEIEEDNDVVADDLDAEFDQLVNESNAQDNRLTTLESGTQTIGGTKTFSSNIKVNGIDERTTNNGVVIDGVTLKDGNVTTTGTGQITADTLVELTADNGVTIDTVSLKDGMVFLAGTPAVNGGIGYASNQFIGYRNGVQKNFLMEGDAQGQTVSDQTVSAVAAVEFTSAMTSTFSYYEMQAFNVTYSSDGVIPVLQVSTDNGSSYEDGAADYAWESAAGSGTNSDAADDRIDLQYIGQGNAAGETWSCFMTIVGAHESQNTHFNYTGHGHNTSSNRLANVGNGTYLDTTEVTAFRIFVASGTITGRFKLIGFP